MYKNLGKLSTAFKLYLYEYLVVNLQWYEFVIANK